MASRTYTYMLAFVSLCSIISPAIGKPLDYTALVLREFSGSDHLSLTAVTVRNTLNKRSESFKPKLNCDHHYADHTAVLSGTNTRFAKTSMTYRWPALILEDIEEDVSQIQCSDSAIMLQFAHQSAFEVASESWSEISRMLIISSHIGCNRDGERSPYMVLGVSHSVDPLSAVFLVQTISWRDAYESMTVQFGTSDGVYQPHALRTDTGLRRRHISASALAAGFSASVSSAPSDETIPAATSSYPSTVFPAAPSATPTALSSEGNISWQIPGDFQVVSIPDSISVNCTGCSSTGNVVVTTGEFTVSSSNSDVAEAVNFLDHGYISATVNDMTAHIVLETSALAASHKFDVKVATIPLTPFAIPSVATVGPQIQFHIVGNIDVSSGVDVTYGFDLTVPDNSSVTLNVGDLGQSTSTGLSNSQITPLPLNSTTPDASLELGIGFRPELLMGIDIIGGNGQMNAGMFFDLPYLSVNISQVSSLDGTCTAASNSTLLNTQSNSAPNLILVEPSVEFDVGLQADLAVKIAGVRTESKGQTTTLAATTFTLPTACLSWDGAKYATVARWNASAPTATGSVTTTPLIYTSNAAGASQPNLLSGRIAAEWSVEMLLGVVLVALSL